MVGRLIDYWLNAKVLMGARLMKSSISESTFQFETIPEWTEIPAKWFNLSWLEVDRRYDLSLRRLENERSAEQVETGQYNTRVVADSLSCPITMPNTDNTECDWVIYLPPLFTEIKFFRPITVKVTVLPKKANARPFMPRLTPRSKLTTRDAQLAGSYSMAHSKFSDMVIQFLILSFDF